MKRSKSVLGWSLVCIGLSACSEMSPNSSQDDLDGKSGASYKAPAATVFSPTEPVTREESVDMLVPQITVNTEAMRTARIMAQNPRPANFWWPEILNVSPLRRYEAVNPLGADFDYAKAYKKLDIESVKADMRKTLTDSKNWWPADYGNYGPFFIRMAWHSAGTYRKLDGRGGADGGQQRFEPLNSWPDNANLDKARRLIQPVVDKYYPNLSWADAMILAGDIAFEDSGFETLGFAGGRVDDWTPDLVYWGPEDEFLKSNRRDKEGRLLQPLAASVMGLIYVNPEGPDGKPDPLLSAKSMRETFGQMGMNDEETVALVAGGHTLGKAHGAHKPEDCQVGPSPTAAPVEDQAFGWKNICGKGNAEDTVTSGLEGAWSPDPIKWTHEYLTNLYKYDWELQKGPGGKFQWYAKGLEKSDFAPNAHIAGEKAPIMMLTTDLALRYDPIYAKISKKFLDDPKLFGKAFAKAWFKLIHRDLGPKSRYLGSDFTSEDFLWQDPLPAVDHELVSDSDVEWLEQRVLESGLSIQDLVKTAWSAASSFRGSDMRGGINGARIRLEPQRSWAINEPEMLEKTLTKLEMIQQSFNETAAGKSKSKVKVSLADLIVIAGNAAVKQAAAEAGVTLDLEFTPGRTDASQSQTDVKSFGDLELGADGFRNYYSEADSYLAPAQAFVDRADQLRLTVPEMTVLTGGLRVLGANHGNSQNGVFTDRVGVLTNDFFVNLMDQNNEWSLADNKTGVFVATDRESGEKKWTATTADLIFGSRSDLRVVAFSYSGESAKTRFVYDFGKAWQKVMMLDRFDIKSH